MIERTFIEQKIRRLELDEFFKKELDKAGFTGLEIVKTPLVTRLVLHVARPGFAIGKSGATIRQLTIDVEKHFGITNPQIEIAEIKEPDLNAQVIVDKIKTLLERNYSWRSIGYKIVKDIQDAGAQGVELVFSGKLAGKGGRKRATRIAIGYMKKVGDQVKYVDYAKASAYPKAGAIGIKLRIIHPSVAFPDKANYRKIIQDRLDEIENPTHPTALPVTPPKDVVVEELPVAKAEEEKAETAPPAKKPRASKPRKKATEKEDPAQGTSAAEPTGPIPEKQEPTEPISDNESITREPSEDEPQ